MIKLFSSILLFLAFSNYALAGFPNNHHRAGDNKGYTLDYIKRNKSELYFDNKKIAVFEILKDEKFWQFICIADKQINTGFASLNKAVNEAKNKCIKEQL